MYQLQVDDELQNVQYFKPANELGFDFINFSA